MSWRVLIALIVLMLGAAGLAGVALGDWLAAKAPGVSDTTRANLPQTDKTPVLDASGRPYVPEPPQPLIDGSQGVPKRVVTDQWEVKPLSLFDGFIDPMVVISRDGQSYTVSDMLSQAGRDLPQGPTDIQTIDIASSNVATTTTNRSTDSVAQTAPAPVTSWQDELKKAIETCNKAGFFERPSCLDRARERFCTPNQAWGKTPMCPAKPTPGLMN